MKASFQPDTKQSHMMRVIESSLWLLGVMSIGLFVVLQIQQRAGAQEAVAQFYSNRPEANDSLAFSDALKDATAKADQTNWSQARIDSYARNSAKPSGSALAVLRIPRLSLEAPVFEGALDHELDRGPGWIRGTAPIGTAGNLGIAGHRDGFFRSLKDIVQGDVIEVLGPESLIRYTVSDTWIVDPDAVHVLDSTEQASITLVTCYPFYFVGHAPQRFIVRAVVQAI